MPSKVVPFLLVFNPAMPALFQVAVSENGVYPHSGHFDEIMMVDQWIASRIAYVQIEMAT